MCRLPQPIAMNHVVLASQLPPRRSFASPRRDRASDGVGQRNRPVRDTSSASDQSPECVNIQTPWQRSCNCWRSGRRPLTVGDHAHRPGVETSALPVGAGQVGHLTQPGGAMTCSEHAPRSTGGAIHSRWSVRSGGRWQRTSRGYPTVGSPRGECGGCGLIWTASTGRR
jgi:hypothetical protein